MASQTPILPFLRPLSLPRPSTVRHFLSFSTSSICRAATARQQPREGQDTNRSTLQSQFTDYSPDRNLIASRTASPTYPPSSMKSLPRPKESRASRRTAHPRPKRPYPTRQPTHTPVVPQKLIPEPVVPLSAEQCAPNLPYFVTRTRSNELPVYTDFKRGGNLKLTLVRKVSGDAERLRDQLRHELKGKLGKPGSEKERCVVNSITGQVVIKGHVKTEVTKFLRERMF